MATRSGGVIGAASGLNVTSPPESSSAVHCAADGQARSMIGSLPCSILTGAAPAGDAGLNVASKPTPATTHSVADGQTTADHDCWPSEVTNGLALVPGSNVITLPWSSAATHDDVDGHASPSVVGGSSFGDVEVGSSTSGDDAFGAAGSNVYAWFSVVIVVHWVADGQASAIGTSPAAIWAGGLALPVAGSNSVDRPLPSIATHSAVDGHWMCNSDWPWDVSTGRGADHVSVVAEAVELSSSRERRARPGAPRHPRPAASSPIALPSAAVRSSRAFHAPCGQIFLVERGRD